MNLYIGNLNYGTRDNDLQSLFEQIGEVSSAKIIMDRVTGRSKGFGFVEMTDDAAAQKAIGELDGATVEGRAIRVAVAKPREERPARNANYSNSRW